MPCLAIAACPAIAAGWRWSGDAGLGYDSNPASVRVGSTEMPAAFIPAALRTELSQPLSRLSALQLRLSLNTEAYDRHERLSNAKAGAQLRFSYRAGETFHAPLLAAWASLAAAEYGSSIRSGADYRAGLFVQQRINTAFSTRLGLQWANRDAAGRAFGISSRSATWNLDWTPTPALSLYAGYQYYDGDLVSTTTPRPAAIAAASAMDADDAFGGQGANQFAFRLDSYAHLGTAGFNLPLIPGYALDVQWQNIVASANTGSRYRREFAVISLLARF